MIIAALLSLTLATDPNTVAPVTVHAPQSPTKAETFKDPNRIVCRREEVVGSHRPQKVCMTKHEWDVSEEQSRNSLRDGGLHTFSPPLEGGGVNPTGGLVGGVSMGPR
jgi:hypothetical protein